MSPAASIKFAENSGSLSGWLTVVQPAGLCRLDLLERLGVVPALVWATVLPTKSGRSERSGGLLTNAVAPRAGHAYHLAADSEVMLAQ